MKDIITDVYHALHTLESCLNYIEGQYGFIKEDDMQQLYSFLVQLCEETHQEVADVKERVNNFQEMNLASLEIVSGLLTQYLQSNQGKDNEVYHDFTMLQRIIDFITKQKKGE